MVQDKNIPPAILGLKLIAAVLIVLATAMILNPGQAYAQNREESDVKTDSSQVSGYIPDEYRFIVASGNNQTLLVRRSIQLYDRANDSINLSEAQTIYVETNVVRDMGARDLIYPEQMLDVMSRLIAIYADSSQELGEDTLAAWQVYADKADFDISHISPQNVTLGDDGQVIDNEADGEEPTFTPDESSVETATDDSNGWSVWLALAGAAAIVWYGYLRFRDNRSN